MSRLRASLLLCLALAVPAKAVAQQPRGSPPARPTHARPDAAADQPTEAPKYEDQVVVTASRVEQKLVNAPATVSLISAQTIASSPSASYAELLRAVPGLNVTQTSARDINLVSRSASGTLSTSQLALIDGRIDLPGLLRLRGLGLPAGQPVRDQADRSDPRPGVGGVGRQRAHRRRQRHHQVAARAGRREPARVRPARSAATPTASSASNGSLFSVSGSHAAAPSTIGWPTRSRAGFSTQDALGAAERPDPERHQHALPRLREQRHQPAEVRRPRRLRLARHRRKLVFAGGFAGTEGMIHTGIGPFDIDRGTFLAYGKVNYSKGGMQAERLRQPPRRRRHQPPVASTPTGTVHPVRVQEHHLRRRGQRRRARGATATSSASAATSATTAFDLSLAPRGDSRTEAGVYGQDEIFLSEHFRCGGRRPRRQVLVDQRRRASRRA